MYTNHASYPQVSISYCRFWLFSRPRTVWIVPICLQGPISFYFKHERNFTNSFLILATFTSSTGVCAHTQTPKKKLFKFAWIKKKNFNNSSTLSGNHGIILMLFEIVQFTRFHLLVFIPNANRLCWSCSHVFTYVQSIGRKIFSEVSVF